MADLATIQGNVELLPNLSQDSIHLATLAAIS